MSRRSSHSRKGGFVKGHFRNGTWVSSHYRQGANVSDYEFESAYQPTFQTPIRQEPPGLVPPNSRLHQAQSPFTHITKCWWCGAVVFFHRTENGGCALFDDLGPPWPIHYCWQAYKDMSQFRLYVELQSLGFDGRTYPKPRERLRLRNLSFPVDTVGFVLQRDAQQIADRSIAFVLKDWPAHTLTIAVHENWKQEFTPYSLYRLRITRTENKGRSEYRLHEPILLTPNNCDPPVVSETNFFQGGSWEY